MNKLGGPDAYVAYRYFNSLPVFVAFGLYLNHISSNIMLIWCKSELK